MSSVTLTQLIEKVRRRAGIEESAYITASENTISDTEITDYINEAASYLHQHLANSSEDYYTTKTQLTVSSGASSCNLPSDFFKLRALDLMTGSDGYREVLDYTVAERNDYRGYSGLYHWPANVRYKLEGSTLTFIPTNSAAGTYHLTYTPQYTNLSSGDDTVSFPMNWHDYVVCYAAIQCLMKLQLPSDELKEHLTRLERMITRGAARRGQPRRMLSLRNRSRYSW